MGDIEQCLKKKGKFTSMVIFQLLKEKPTKEIYYSCLKERTNYNEQCHNALNFALFLKQFKDKKHVIRSTGYTIKTYDLRTFRKICMHGSRLNSLVPRSRVSAHGRLLRKSNNYSLFKCRTERFKSSFFSQQHLGLGNLEYT